MTRVTVCALLCVLILAGQVAAAEIGGYVYVKGNVDQEALLTVAYGFYHPRYTQSTIEGHCHPGSANVKGERDLAVPFPKVAMIWQAGKPCVYRCINMRPGLYLLSAKLGNAMVSKLINVPTKDFRASIDFSLDPGKTGALEVVLPSTAKHNIHITRAWNTNQFNWKRPDHCPESIGIPVESEPGDTKISVDGLAEGKYKVVLYQTDTTAPYPGLRKNKFLKLWVLDIKAGRATIVRAK